MEEKLRAEQAGCLEAEKVAEKYPKSMTKFGCGGVAAAEKYGTGVSEYGGGMERNGGETAAVSGNGDDILGKMVAF
ncbi:hypothetical protein LINPERHAP1_LOCUS1018 [Linum perenne]